MATLSLTREEAGSSRLCLGTMTFGEQNSADQAFSQLDLALERGIRFIDTAEMYPVMPRAETCHRTEEIVGAWLARQDRSRVLVATKIAGPARMPWIRGGVLDAAGFRTAIEASLTRLRTDYIDLYQIHWPARNIPVFGATRLELLTTKDTVAIDTPAASATSRMVVANASSDRYGRDWVHLLTKPQSASQTQARASLSA